MAIARWDEVRTGPLGERMIRFLERYPKADEIYITSAMDGDHGQVSHHYGLSYRGSPTAAIDIGAGGYPAGSAKMRDVARWLYDNFADYTVELIHTTPFQDDNGFYVKNQARDPGGDIYGEATRQSHKDHVHWATSADLMTAMEQGAGPSPLDLLAIPNTTPVWGWDASDWDWSGDQGPMDLVAAQRAQLTVSPGAGPRREVFSRLAEVKIQEGESIESALRRFKRKVQQEDIIKDIKKHSFYLKPGDRRRAKQALARKRTRKKQRRESE